MDLLSYLLGKSKGSGGGITPTGTINITENGTYDVTNYASAEVEITPPVVPTLPSSYTAVNYLQSSGNQYIDTGYKPNANTKIEFNYLQSVAGAVVMGARTTSGTDRFTLATYEGNCTFFYGDVEPDNTYIRSNIANNNFINISIEKNKIIFNGTEYTNFLIENFPDYSIYLFGSNTGGSATAMSKANIGRFKISENSVLLHDYIPCMRNSDSVLGMYDLIDEEFLTNSGTGSFTADPLYNY